MVFPILGGNSAVGGYAIDNSLRFNSSDTPNLARTPSASNRDLFTISLWAKRSNLNTGARQVLFGVGNPATTSQVGFEMRFDNSVGDGKLRIGDYVAGVTDYVYLVTDAIFRDVSAWYHIVYVYDSAQATNTNRTKLYVNGNQITSFSSPTYPNQNQDSAVNSATQHTIGNQDGNGYEYNGYLSEINFIDGQALSPTSFGEFDEDSGIWKPIQYTGSYGTNGFYLDFENSGSLGADQSGNGNNFTPTNLASTDQTTDTPTNNFATLNANDVSGGALSQGNLLQTSTGASNTNGTVGMPTGKWYWEIYINNVGGGVLGIGTGSAEVGTALADLSNIYGYAPDGNKYQNTSASSYGASYTTGDIIGVKFDADTRQLEFLKNNSSQGVAFTVSSGDTYLPQIHSNGTNFTMNFGQEGSFAGNKTAQGNADANGYGDFYYAPPSGYLALCTQNLATALSPTIDDGSQYFNTVLYTGTGSSTSITGVGFQPDLVYTTSRSNGYNNGMFDSVRGVQKEITTNTNNAEATLTTAISSFDSDGFSFSGSAYNTSAYTFVAWNWKANAGSTSSNTDGSITSTVQANTTAGFSIVTYTGTGTAGTIGHGLGKKPQCILLKNRSFNDSWITFHEPEGATKFMSLDTTGASSDFGAMWNDTEPTTSVFSIGSDSGGRWVNSSGDTYVAYCFHSVEGYSSVGNSYTGNGSSDGTFVYTGFRPAWVMTKGASTAQAWSMRDNKRDSYNSAQKAIYANASDAESDNANNSIDLLSNGFKIRNLFGTENSSGQTYIYMAFAESPFCTSTGIPVTAR